MGQNMYTYKINYRTYKGMQLCQSLLLCTKPIKNYLKILVYKSCNAEMARKIQSIGLGKT